MPRTFCSDTITAPGRHHVQTERGGYIMSGSWIDTTCPNDMMDYDFTAPIHELMALHEKIRLGNIRDLP